MTAPDLSPGDYHRRVPTDLHANLRFRRVLLTEAAKSKRLQAEIVEACRRDFFFWVKAFVFQVNPKKFGDEVGPFLPFPVQVRVVRTTIARLFGEQQAMIWEKSRYQGATWLMILLFLWLCLFHRHKSFLLVSHTEDAVYKGEDDSLFKKIEFVLRYLPDWMVRGAPRSASAKRLTFHFPATDSFIAGAANTSRVGVGQRFTAVGCDEFAKQPNATEILSNTADTGARLFVSTHYGVGTAFHGMTSAEGAVKAVLHWSENPMQNAGVYSSDPAMPEADRPIDRTYEYPPEFEFARDGKPHGGPCPGLRSPWYDREVQERLRLGGSERDIAQHLDIDAQGSTFQYFAPHVIRGLQKKTCRPGERYDVVVDPDANEIVRLEPSEAGLLWLWLELDWKGRPPEDQYAIGCDPAAGTGATPTCMTILSSRGEKVGAYYDPFSRPDQYAPVYLGLGKLFWKAFLIWEQNGPSAALSDAVVSARYAPIYYRPVSETARIKQASTKPGWFPQKDTTTRLLQNYRTALVNGDFVNRCRDSLDQCLDYVYVQNNIEHTGRKDAKGDPSGARENHGDRVIADALAWLGLNASNRLARHADENEPRDGKLHPSSLLARMVMAEAEDKPRRPVASWLERLGAGR